MGHPSVAAYHRGMSPVVRIVSRLFGLTLSLLVLAGCSAVSPSDSPPDATFDETSPGDCPEAFRAWVSNAESLNSPGADPIEVLVNGERIERRVFALCTLAEAEQLNGEVLLESAPGFRRPMIEPDFRTFAEVECVDESPLLDDTPLCAEVGH